MHRQFVKFIKKTNKDEKNEKYRQLQLELLINLSNNIRLYCCLFLLLEKRKEKRHNNVT